jgi:hypothetical protein
MGNCELLAKKHFKDLFPDANGRKFQPCRRVFSFESRTLSSHFRLPNFTRGASYKRIAQAIRAVKIQLSPALGLRRFSEDGSPVTKFAIKLTMIIDTCTGKDRSCMRSITGSACGIPWNVTPGLCCAFVNSSREISRWDLASNQALPLLQGHPDNIYALGFSPDGTLLASLDGNQDLILWDTATWEESRFVTDTGGAGALAFSPDGRLLAVAGYEDNVSLWDVQTGNLVVQFQGHPRGVADVTFSNDGTLLVTAGYDGLVRLWAVP